MHKSYLKQMLLLGLVVMFSLGFEAKAFAFGLGSLTSSGGGDKGVNISALADKESALKTRYTSALNEIATAQMFFAKALGNKEEADSLKIMIDSLSQGNTSDDTICKIAAQSKNISSEQAEKMKGLNKLSADQKENIVSGLLPYAKGTADTAILGKEYADHLKSTSDALKKASPTDAIQIKNKMGLTLSLAPQLPEIGKTHISTASTLVQFAKENKLDTKGAEKALENL